jgi:hypothetical protein
MDYWDLIRFLTAFFSDSFFLPGRSLAIRCVPFGFPLFSAYYNYCWMHGSLPGTPAMAAGVAGHPWPLEELYDAECAAGENGQGRGDEP